MKTEPTMDADSDGIVAWLNDHDGEMPASVSVDVSTFIGLLQAGVSFSPERARRLAAELIEIAEHIERAEAVTAVDEPVVERVARWKCECEEWTPFSQAECRNCGRARP